MLTESGYVQRSEDVCNRVQLSHRGHAGLENVLRKANETVETSFPEPPEGSKAGAPTPHETILESTMAPRGTMGRPAEIAAIALFLASDDSSYENGVDLAVDGGFSAI